MSRYFPLYITAALVTNVAHEPNLATVRDDLVVIIGGRCRGFSSRTHGTLSFVCIPSTSHTKIVLAKLVRHIHVLPIFYFG